MGGGTTGSVTGVTEIYNGTSWVSAPTMTTGRSGVGSGGSQTEAIAFGGYNGTGDSAATEEFNGETLAANIVTITTG